MDQPWLVLVLGLGLGLLIAGLVGLALACRRLGSRLTEMDAAHRERIDTLTRDIAGYQQGTIRMGEELVALREQLRRMEDKQQRIEQHDPQSMPYNQAARLVGMGASLEDLTQSCGLSKAEAELVMKMYAARKP
ncbi:Protein of unknown function [Halopseudomonas xinjiangensis]|uniref:DUF2802 domain-containing protein n=1 Tax=Halopseudomonas xinjiangensis TaxID=487184 RepID=A0A1H1NC16_9GAMM|nr:DUF2802 domain-containing protein [Halopseudomonas xinjiangensis]SDR96430.1 Protein of unknown function [Halopseudomonas xinjiangensis]